MNSAPEQTDERRSAAESTAGPVGVRGWLLWLGIGQVFGVLVGLTSWGTLGESLGGDVWAFGEQVRWHRPLLLLETAAQVAMPIAGVVGLFLISRRDPMTPTFYVWFLGLLAAYGVAGYIGIQAVSTELEALLARHGGSLEEVRQMRTDATSNALRLVAVGLVWGLYWRRSRRVKNTFGATLPATTHATHHGA